MQLVADFQKEMIVEYSHLFFLLSKTRDLEEKRKIRSRQDSILIDMKARGYDYGRLIDGLKLEKSLQESYDSFFIFTDGGVRREDNKVRAASSFVVYGDKKLIHKSATYIGDSIELQDGSLARVSISLSEFYGLYLAMKFMIDHKLQNKPIVFLTDHSSMVDHIEGKESVNLTLESFLIELRDMYQQFTSKEVRHIPRDANKLADSLVDQILFDVGRG